MDRTKHVSNSTHICKSRTASGLVVIDRQTKQTEYSHRFAHNFVSVSGRQWRKERSRETKSTERRRCCECRMFPRKLMYVAGLHARWLFRELCASLSNVCKSTEMYFCQLFNTRSHSTWKDTVYYVVIQTTVRCSDAFPKSSVNSITLSISTDRLRAWS